MCANRKITYKHLLVQSCATANSLRDGIVLWELHEQKCQQRVWNHTTVAQTGLAGWMMLILQWKMVKFPGRSALVNVHLALRVRFLNSQQRLLWRTVDPNLSTNLFRWQTVSRATVLQIECEVKNPIYLCLTDFT